MIDINLLESAKLIKIEFNRVQKELLTYESDIKSLIDFLSEKIEVLQKFNKESEKPGFTREDLDKKIKFLIDEIVQIEIEEKKLADKVKTINEKMEKLKEEEITLYKCIKEKYTSLSDEQIYNLVQSHLKKHNL